MFKKNAILGILLVILCCCSYQNATENVKQEGDKVTSMVKEDNNSVESLLKKVDEIKPGQNTFELFVPEQVTLKGKPIEKSAAMAIIVDNLLGKGLFPNGFEEKQNGRLYKYSNVLPKQN